MLTLEGYLFRKIYLYSILLNILVSLAGVNAQKTFGDACSFSQFSICERIAFATSTNLSLDVQAQTGEKYRRVVEKGLVSFDLCGQQRRVK